ncbi:hypothetical protein [Cloacibacterium sp.]|uniref:hypothetical protein n=1 Tax=Cloacibacterium sp. TaxID=1913682 RepID=UPI0039E6852D
MEGLIALIIIISIIYWGAAIFLTISGTIILVKNKDESRKTEGISKLIVGIIMLIIGGSFCGPFINV